MKVGLFLAALSGALLALTATDVAQAPVWLALAPVWYACAAAEKRRHAFACAALAALIWSFAGCWFIATQAVGGAIASAVYTALYFTAGILAVRPLARLNVWCAVFGSAAVWTLLEILRARVPVLGWPWLLLGHAAVDYPHLRQLAELLGVWGLTFLIASFNALGAFVLPAFVSARVQAPPGSPRARQVCAAVWFALLFAALLFGRVRVAQLESQIDLNGPRVALLQGCEYQKIERTLTQQRMQLDNHLALHRKAVDEAPPGERPDLVCWAETMVPGVYNRDEHSERFAEVVRSYGVPTIFGSDWINDADLELEDVWQQRWHNGVFFMDAQGLIQAQYFKRRLVPFGEYIPWTKTFPFLKQLRSVTRDTYTPGSDPSPIFEVAGKRCAFNICVEDVHPDLAREAVEAGAEVLVNVTNDGWFYGSSGAVMHRRAAVLRAVEVRRPLLRITNSGHTLQVDPLGRVELLVPPDVVGIGRTRLKALLEPPECTWACRLGETGVAALLGILLGLCWASAWRGRKPSA
ncbi:MAG: apolipoprotein N-acyltransferase [Planctomycetes bacterium]|nr:apolipoprotein N-acyltransferase [Planctomycetota bacterium]